MEVIYYDNTKCRHHAKYEKKIHFKKLLTVIQ